MEERPLLLHLIIAAIWLVCAMGIAWLVQRLTRNCGWVDAVWSAATALGATFVALHAGGPRSFLASAMVLLWGGRLAWHIARRTPGAPEDPRYATFRREWGAAFETRLFGFLMVQAAAAWVLVATVGLAAANAAPFPTVADIAAVLVLCAAVWGEGVADAQMQKFRAAGSGGVCDTGLWGWSRHPNYFFEILGWCAYPLLAVGGGGHPAGWLALAGPLMMYVLLRYVSGVPPLETSMLERRGDAFRDYQARVSVLLPWPPARRG